VRYEPAGRGTVVGTWSRSGVAPFPAGAVIELDAATAAGRVYRTGRPARSTDLTHSRGSLAPRLHELGYRSSLAAPIYVDGDVWGALAVADVREAPLAEGSELRLARFSELVAQALAELRELARGIHPAVLTARGLAAAVEELVHRAPLPVVIETLPDAQLPESVEVAAYYLVSEALANVAKHSRASVATVAVARAGDRAIVEVADDGIGGADLTRGSGLRGLADRIGALGGTLAVDSRRGAGTKVRALIPCGRESRSDVA
jgi:GAF domain/Histidine kinase-, DNA gyrase B-, and HSP90-like ATPase